MTFGDCRAAHYILLNLFPHFVDCFVLCHYFNRNKTSWVNIWLLLSSTKYWPNNSLLFLKELLRRRSRRLWFRHHPSLLASARPPVVFKLLFKNCNLTHFLFAEWFFCVCSVLGYVFEGLKWKYNVMILQSSNGAGNPFYHSVSVCSGIGDIQQYHGSYHGGFWLGPLKKITDRHIV